MRAFKWHVDSRCFLETQNNSARHPLDLSGLAPGGKSKTLFHYTAKVGALNIANGKAKQADRACLTLNRSSI